ncbi:MAG: GNAT family N-acetyltransferase [Lishizhenia sp.]
MLRKAVKGDEFGIHKLIVELAVYEKEPNAVIVSAQDLGKHLFDEKICDAFVIDLDGEIIGFALYFISYSTWKGKCLYLEDFVVTQSYRGKGYGKQLFLKVKEEAQILGMKRMSWQVLEWNTSAIEFYKSFEAELDSEWLNGRFSFD